MKDATFTRITRSSRGACPVGVRPAPDGLGDDQVHQVDDRRLVGHHLDVVQVLALDGRRPLRVEV